MNVIINIIQVSRIILFSTVGGQHTLDTVVDRTIFLETHVSTTIVIYAVLNHFLLHFMREDEVVVRTHEYSFDTLEAKSFAFRISFFRIFYF